MCCRLGNGHHCLTFLSVLGFLQALVGTPITVLSVLVLVQGKLGFLLSPFWCGALLMVSGGLALCIRPTRLAFIICIHMLLNVFAIVACIGAGALSGLYGVAVILPGYDSLILTGGSNTSVPVSNTTQTVECVFSPSSPLYPEDMRLVLRHIDELVPVCANLAYYWTHLVANMSLCFIGCVLSAVSAIASCATPCFEDRYQRKWSPQTES